MLAQGNSDVRLCALNIIRTMKGTVPFAREKGIDPRWIDSPMTEQNMMFPDIQQTLKRYEQRINPEDIQFADIAAVHGDFGVVVEARR